MDLQSGVVKLIAVEQLVDEFRDDQTDGRSYGRPPPQPVQAGETHWRTISSASASDSHRGGGALGKFNPRCTREHRRSARDVVTGLRIRIRHDSTLG